MKNRNRESRQQPMLEELFASRRPLSRTNYAGAGTGCGVKVVSTPGGDGTSRIHGRGENATGKSLDTRLINSSTRKG
jgi:hypothetical protein